MAVVDVPMPHPRRVAPSGPNGQGGLDVKALREDLRARVDGEVRFDAGSKGAYATDASNYRQVPIGVVLPRTVEAGAEAVAVCREHGAPVLSRGGGTSLAGEATNVAVVLDWTKYCHRLVSVDSENRTCVVEPGIVLDDLNAQLAPYGLEFGPRPSTHSHCAIGGMIGNNSCGATAQRSGKTDENVTRVEMLTYDGLRCWVGATPREEYDRIVSEGGRKAELYRGLAELGARSADLVRERFPQIPRRVSGYNLDALLPDRDLDLAGLLVGSEGTLATILHAEVKLLPVLPHKSMVVLGYDSIEDAGDAVPEILAKSEPVILEGIDDRLVYFERTERLSEEALGMLPEGAGWLLIQFGADSQDEADRQAQALLDALGLTRHSPTVTFSDNAATEEEIWSAREAGLGATARPPGMPDTWPGWEDSAVAPDRVGDYLRDLSRLFTEYGLDRPSLYGHFGQGCIHVRIPFDLLTAEGVDNFTRFLEAAARLVRSYGGSLSGEHGDGQARGPLLETMFGPEIVGFFDEVKRLFDPGNQMNPGKVVASHGVADNLRLGPDWHPQQRDTNFGYPDDGGSFERAALRCVGVGNCRSHEGGVMCPSYKATGDEEHSTRGRARLLYEMLNGHGDGPVTDGWRSTEVRDALDLCLACKGCKSDCPVNVDMATYKAEFLSHHYAGRLRPMAHYAMGWLPLWSKLAAPVPGLANAVLHAPGLAGPGKRLAGIAPEREAPPFAGETLQHWWARRQGDRADPDPAGDRTVVIWPDSFTNHFHPHIGQAAVEVLESAGFDVVVPRQPVCCGLTLISTGQLALAGRVLHRTLRVLRPWLEAGTPIVGLEPSCTAVFRSDAAEMFPEDADVRRLSGQVWTLAELLTRKASTGWQVPRVAGRATVQTHCHQHAIMGFTADTELMERAGIEARPVSGCCGLAGNFGFERGHYEVSQTCAEDALLPAVREAGPRDLVLADGFSCRTQITQAGTGRTALHLAEALHLGMDGGGDEGTQRSRSEPIVPRPEVDRRASWIATGVAGLLGLLGATAGGAVAARLLRRRRCSRAPTLR